MSRLPSWNRELSIMDDISAMAREGDMAVSQPGQVRAEEVAARNAKVAEVQGKICRVARLSEHGSHGIDFFDAIMEVYLFGRDAGAKAGYIAAKEDAATLFETEENRYLRMDAQSVAAAIRKLEPK